jgi:hypothetical protein
MPLTDFDRTRLRSWDIQVSEDDNGKIMLVFPEKATSFEVAVAVLTVCHNHGVLAHNVHNSGSKCAVVIHLAGPR